MRRIEMKLGHVESKETLEIEKNQEKSSPSNMTEEIKMDKENTDFELPMDLSLPNMAINFDENLFKLED